MNVNIQVCHAPSLPTWQKLSKAPDQSTEDEKCVQREATDGSLQGIVQRDLPGFEIRLKRSQLLIYRVTKFSFLILKGHHHEKV
jgi:hypothetical protein